MANGTTYISGGGEIAVSNMARDGYMSLTAKDFVTYDGIGLRALKDDLAVKIITSGSVFALPDGRYYCAATVANMPNSSYGYVEMSTWSDEKMIKVYDLKANANIYLNTYANGAWAGWTVK